MLCEFSRKKQSNCSLDFAGGESLRVVVRGELRGFRSDTLEQVGNERIHNAHGLGRDTSVRMNLLQHLVDVDRVGLGALLLSNGLFRGIGDALFGDLLLSDWDGLSFGSHCGVWWCE